MEGRRHNTAKLNLDSRAGIWGLTLVRLHRQASKPYLEIATTPLDISPLEGEPGQTVGQVHRRLTTAYKTEPVARKIREGRGRNSIGCLDVDRSL